MKTVIVGGPKTGKTTKAAQLGGTVIHTDDERSLNNFSAQSASAMRHFDTPGAWTLEGVTAVRALRKWLATHPTGKPCDTVIHLKTPKTAQTLGQAHLAQGCETIWQEIAPELKKRGVAIHD